jgi:hypothetical protein
MKSFTVLVLAIAVAGLAPVAAAKAAPHPTATPAPTPTPVADPAVTKIARQQFVAWQEGSIDKNAYAAALLPKLTDDKVTEVAHALAALGPLTNTVFIGPFEANDIPPDARGYIYQMQCTGGAVYLWMIIDGKGKIATLFFKNRLEEETIERPAAPVPSPTA